MRKWFLVLLLAGCGSESSGDRAAEGGGGAPEAAGLENLAEPAASETPEQLQARARTALAGVIREGGTARYSGLRAGSAGAICGHVDSKQADGRYGGPKPFVVTPEGVALVSASSPVSFDDPSDIFPDFYIRWCASPEELEVLEPELRKAAPAGAPVGAEAAPEALPPAAPAVTPPPAPPAEEKAAPAKEGSFSDAVIRKRD